MELPHCEIGRHAADLLLQQIIHEDAPTSPAVISITCLLITRESLWDWNT
jgi:DNA-binding LacI/PurR family transcriptional regulator